MKLSAAQKRLTYIVNYVSADDAQHFVHIPNLLAELAKLGWLVELVSERGGSGESEVLGHRVRFLSENARWGRVIPLARHLLAGRRRRPRIVFVRISKVAALISAVLGTLFGWKTVFWLSGTVEDFNLRRGIRGRLNFASMWLLLRLIDRLATGPKTMVCYYAARYGISKRKIMMLYNDINIQGINPLRPVVRDGVTRVLLVHRLSPVRETDRYIPALLSALGNHAQLSGKRVVFDICGDGPERPSIEKLVARTPEGVEVRLHGAIPQRKLTAFYEKATIFVMPSYREGFPRVIIEAMAHGLPIVATDAGGTLELCPPSQRNYVVDRQDPTAFGAAIERLLASATEQRRLRIDNLERVRLFDTQQVARMYDRALSDLIGA